MDLRIGTPLNEQFAYGETQISTSVPSHEPFSLGAINGSCDLGAEKSDIATVFRGDVPITPTMDVAQGLVLGNHKITPHTFG